MQNEISFQDLPLSQDIQKALKEMGFEKPTEIQAQSLPALIENDVDFVGQAQTGTGKTAAFGLPAIMKLDNESRKPQCLVLAPTRELALQISEEIHKFTKYQRIRKIELCGGMSYRPQLESLKHKNPQMVIGTPGRVIDLLNRGVLDLSEVKQIVLDEADEMLNMGFWDEVQEILAGANPARNLWMFSATMPKAISTLIKKEFKDPVFIKTKTKNLSNDNIKQSYYLVKARSKVTALYQILDSIEDFYGVIFCNTKIETKDLGMALMEKNYNVSVLHGDLAQTDRQDAMRAFKQGRTKVLLCTDVASRGIDVEDLTHVINFGLPRDKESYVHRIGRTGRAGKEGTAISILSNVDVPRLAKIERVQAQKIERARLLKGPELKKIHIEKRTRKMAHFRELLESHEREYHIDDLFTAFEDKFSGLDKTDSLKVIFNDLFKIDLRKIDEQSDIEQEVANENRRSAGSDRGGRRSRDRRDRRDRGDRSGDRRERRSRDRGERGGERRGERSERSGTGRRKSASRDHNGRAESPYGSNRKSSYGERSERSGGSDRPKRRSSESSDRRTESGVGGFRSSPKKRERPSSRARD